MGRSCGYEGFWLLDIRFSEEELPIQIGQIDSVEINLGEWIRDGSPCMAYDFDISEPHQNQVLHCDTNVSARRFARALEESPERQLQYRVAYTVRSLSLLLRPLISAFAGP